MIIPLYTEFLLNNTVYNNSVRTSQETYYVQNDTCHTIQT
jgi:hypothetical protein